MRAQEIKDRLRERPFQVFVVDLPRWECGIEVGRRSVRVYIGQVFKRHGAGTNRVTMFPVHPTDYIPASMPVTSILGTAEHRTKRQSSDTRT